MRTDSLPIQPWARTARDPGALKDVLARAHNERGHFRDINEASVQEEMAADGQLALSESEEDGDMEEEDPVLDATLDKPKTREELYRAKYEMLTSVRAAQEEIGYALDFISLLISKEAPKLGAATMSPALKKELPLGTLGMDMWQKMPNDKVREAQDDLLASNIRLEGLNQSADSLLSAASRLQDNVRKETEYWNQVLRITQDGWNVSRIPHQRGKLAVRFGFSESSPEFSKRGLAAINGDASGRVSLERGVGRKPKALHATLRKGTRVVGTSKLPDLPDPDSTTLGSRIRYARDSLYDEELYHEMVRECRALPSLGVSMSGSTLQFDSNIDTETTLTVSLELVSLDEEKYSLRYDAANVEDRTAQATVLATRLLLTQAHRDRLKKRSEVPPPLSDKGKEEKPPLRLLRPLISFLMHQAALQSLNPYLGNVASILRAAEVDVNHSLTMMRLPERSESWNIDSLIEVLLQPWSSEGLLTIKDVSGEDMNFKITVQTELDSLGSFSTVWMLAVPSSDRQYRFGDLGAFTSATTSILSSALAKASFSMADDCWACDEEEALLIRDNGVGKAIESMEIVLDIGSRSLELQTGEKAYRWMVDGESTPTSFWEAARDVVASKDS